MQVGTALFAVKTKRVTSLYAEEAAYALSIAQEYMEDEDRFSTCIIAVRDTKVAVLEADVPRDLVEKTRDPESTLKDWQLNRENWDMEVRVGRQWRLMDLEERVDFAKHLAVLVAEQNSKICKLEDCEAYPRSWEMN